MRVIVASILIACCVIVSGKNAIVTLLSGMPSNAERYTRLLHFFVYSLRNAGYNGEIMVMYVPDFPIDAQKLGQRLNVKTKLVEKISVENPGGGGNPHYASMLTKLHLWNLLEYDQVMYYDCDFIFQDNPASAFGECSWSNLCATVDTGIHEVNRSIKRGTYFNGGFLVLRPDKTTYKYLLSNLHHANDKYFVEQDLLNQLYQGKWGKLDQKYNLMHCYKLREIPIDVVAIHEKMWVLRDSFPQMKYVWNSSKMKVAYPLSEVLTITPPNKNAAKAVTSSAQAALAAQVANKPMVQSDTPASPLNEAPLPPLVSALTPEQLNKHKHVFKRSRTDNLRTHYNNPEAYIAATTATHTDTVPKSATFDTTQTTQKAIPIPPSIAANSTATEAYRTYVMSKIQSRSQRNKPQRSSHIEASINRAPVNKFARKPVPQAKKQPSKNKAHFEYKKNV